MHVPLRRNATCHRERDTGAGKIHQVIQNAHRCVSAKCLLSGCSTRTEMPRGSVAGIKMFCTSACSSSYVVTRPCSMSSYWSPKMNELIDDRIDAIFVKWGNDAYQNSTLASQQQHEQRSMTKVDVARSSVHVSML